MNPRRNTHHFGGVQHGEIQSIKNKKIAIF